MKKYLPLLNTLLLLVLLMYLFLGKGASNKIVVVDLVKVLDKFEMRKELYAKVEEGLISYSNELDSLETKIKTAVNNREKKKLLSSYREMQERAQSTVAQAENSIREQVSKYLNPLFKEFGKINSCKVLLGVTGSGGVLYGNTEVDMTEELVLFINTKYKNGS